MKNQVLCSLKVKKKIKISSAAVLIGALRVIRFGIVIYEPAHG